MPHTTEPRTAERRAPQSWTPAVLVLLASAVFGFLVLPYWSKARAPQSELVGQLAPDFSLPIFHGGDSDSRIKLSALRGHVVVLDFWASWCRPCAMQAGILSEMAPRQPEDVMFVGVNTADNPVRAREFAERSKLPYVAVLDSGEVADAYGASSLPTLVVIDASGRVVSAASRVMSASELEAAIAQAGERPPG
ncbi:MAG TPA: TlpA disulfide reductase family protein [Polyangiaceae bacterium]|nr:TlpA disulfide reductase family protein [Polyangiaceae bacterium]